MLIFHAHHIGQKLTAHLSSEALEGEALLAIGAFIDNENGLDGINFRRNIAQSSAGMDDAHHGQAVQIHALPRTFFDFPAHHGQVAGKPDFGVCEARSCVDVRGARFNIFTAKLSCWENLRRTPTQQSKEAPIARIIFA